MKKENKKLLIRAILILCVILCCVGSSYEKGFGAGGLSLVCLSMMAGMNLSTFLDDIDKRIEEKRKEKLLNELLKDDKTV